MLLFQITHCQEIDICDNLRFLRHLRSKILLGQPLFILVKAVLQLLRLRSCLPILRVA